MEHGHVQQFSSDDGFGVIRPDDDKPDLSFLATSVESSDGLTDGDQVAYEVIYGAKGPEAVDIHDD